MTNYEKRVAAKELPPMTSMDALFIQSTVEDLVSGKDKLDNELHDILIELKDEIDYLYKDDLNTLAALKKLMDNFTTELVDTFESAGMRATEDHIKKYETLPITDAKVKAVEDYAKQWGGLAPGWQERLNELLHKHPAK